MNRPYLRSNKLAIAIFDDNDDIVDKCCEARNFFAQDKATIASITARSCSKVND